MRNNCFEIRCTKKKRAFTHLIGLIIHTACKKEQLLHLVMIDNGDQENIESENHITEKHSRDLAGYCPAHGFHIAGVWGTQNFQTL